MLGRILIRVSAVVAAFSLVACGDYGDNVSGVYVGTIGSSDNQTPLKIEFFKGGKCLYTVASTVTVQCGYIKADNRIVVTVASPMGDLAIEFQRSGDSIYGTALNNSFNLTKQTTDRQVNKAVKQSSTRESTPTAISPEPLSDAKPQELAVSNIAMKSPNVSKLPESIERFLAQNYPGWRLYHLEDLSKEDRQECHESTTEGPLVRGDFDGNGQRDYAILGTAAGQKFSYAFLGHGARYDPYRIGTREQAIGTELLGIASAGPINSEGETVGVAKYEGILWIRCQADTSQFYLQGDSFVEY